MLRIALPNKGRLESDIRALFTDAGLDLRAVSERSLSASIGDDFTALFVRAQDIPGFVAEGAADCGITGLDCVEEAGVLVDVTTDLGFGRCRVVLARPKESIDELPSGARIATAFPNIAARFFASRGMTARIVTVSGATEVTPALGVADAIVDLVSSGSTLKTNGLVEVETILASSAHLIGTPSARLDVKKREQLAELSTALESVIRARGKRYIMANVGRDALAAVRALMPGISGPTVINVDGDDLGLCAVHAVVDAARVYKTVAALKALGARGILVTRIERLVP